ncbi:Uncharacterised protein [Prevotella intermedia]|nr:Uncharacterised protein [Prevotella intermedia]
MVLQKHRFYIAKEPLLPCKRGSFERSKCSFHHTFLFVLQYFMPYTPHVKGLFNSHLYPQQHLNH